MSRIRIAALCILALVSVFFLSSARTPLLRRARRDAVTGRTSEEVARAAADVGLLFVESSASGTAGARYVVRGHARTIWVEGGTIWMALTEPAHALRSRRERGSNGGLLTPDATPRQTGVGVRLKISFGGAARRPRIVPLERSATRVTVIDGGEPAGGENRPVWSGLRIVDLYPDIDLVLTGEAGQLRPRLEAGPDADLTRVRLRVEGATSVSLGEEGVWLDTPLGPYLLPLPALHRPDGAHRTPLPPPRQSSADEISFPFVDGEPPLPAAAAQNVYYATFLDGFSTGESLAFGLDVEPNTGLAYITGATFAADFSTTTGAFDTTHNGSWDAFVVQLSATGSDVGFVTFLGGTLTDFGHGIALDGNGFTYVTGYTQSADFPTTPGAYDVTHNGGDDVFIVKLNPDGSALAYGTYVGGSGSDVAWDIATNDFLEVFVTGSTLSSDFPVTGGAYDTTYAGNRDAFALKLSTPGDQLIYSTYLGGADFDEALALALETSTQPGASVYLAGSTTSADFPTAPTGFDPTYNGGGDAFLARLSGDGSTLTFSTFLGGGAADAATDVANDGAGFHYVSGTTSSADFPTTTGAYDGALTGPSDAFVTRFNFNLSALAYSTYLGGSQSEGNAFVTVDSVGMAYVVGETWSADFPAPAGGGDNRSCGMTDMYAVRFNASGSTLAYGIVMGGHTFDTPLRPRLDVTNRALYFTGYSDSANFPTTPGAYDAAGSGASSALAVRMSLPDTYGEQTGQQGGTFVFGDTTYEIGAGTFNEATLIVHAPLPDNPTLVICGADVAEAPRLRDSMPAGGGLATVGRSFDMTAVFSATGTVALPQRPFTITVAYDPSAVGGVTEESLRLYRWEEGWVPEPTSAVNLAEHTVTAVVDRPATRAILGEVTEYFLYLPVMVTPDGAPP